MKNKKALALFTFCITLILGLPSGGWAEVSRLTKEEVKEMLEKPEVVVVDVRSGADWDASRSKIKGAIREEPALVAGWGPTLDKSKTYVLYCA